MVVRYLHHPSTQHSVISGVNECSLTIMKGWSGGEWARTVLFELPNRSGVCTNFTDDRHFIQDAIMGGYRPPPPKETNKLKQACLSLFIPQISE